MSTFMTTRKKPSALKNYFSEIKSLAILLVVCTVVATFFNFLNDLGFWINVGFSLGFGIPITLIETVLRTYFRKLSELIISLISVFGGCSVGMVIVYAYLVSIGVFPFGEVSLIFFLNFAIALGVSGLSFYLFWSQYRNKTLALALKTEQLKAAENANLRQQAENRLLQTQMEPHFLFNTLATVQTLIDIDPPAAKQTIGDLSGILRAAMSNAERDECLLEEELAIVRAYLNIQSLRFGDRLIVEENIDESTLKAAVLPMTIQPLVENSIRHAVEHALKPVTVQITIKRTDEALTIVVTDNGEHDSPQSKGNGVSVVNIQKRLKNRFGENAHFTSTAAKPGWRSEFKIPVTNNVDC